MIFADLELARRLERPEAVTGASFVEARRRLAPETGAEWREIGGAYAMFDGAASPITQTFGLGLFAEATPGVLDEVEAFFRERGAPAWHEVSPLAGLQVAERLCGRGYRPVEYTSVMYRPVTAADDPCEHLNLAQSDPRVKVRRMKEGEEELWARTSAGGWAEQPGLADFLFDLGRVIASSDNLMLSFACLDEKPIATSVLRCHEGVALFGGAATLPAARKLGAQRALLAARLGIARANGCDLAMMCAAPGGVSQRNAERQGFRIAYTRTKWQLSWK